MAEIRTVTTLTHKREEIERAIVAYERRLAQARADLSHVIAAISIFAATGDHADVRAYVDLHRIWKRGELMRLCKGWLAAEGPLDTRQLADRAMKAAGLDAGDKVLSRSVAYKIVMAMRQQHLRGTIADAGKRHTARVWALPHSAGDADQLP
jgi:hypothetical protein